LHILTQNKKISEIPPSLAREKDTSTFPNKNSDTMKKFFHKRHTNFFHFHEKAHFFVEATYEKFFTGKKICRNIKKILLLAHLMRETSFFRIFGENP